MARVKRTRGKAERLGGLFARSNARAESRLIKGHIDSHTFIVNTEIGVAILEGNLPFIKFNMPY